MFQTIYKFLARWLTLPDVCFHDWLYYEVPMRCTKPGWRMLTITYYYRKCVDCKEWQRKNKMPTCEGRRQFPEWIDTTRHELPKVLLSKKGRHEHLYEGE